MLVLLVFLSGGFSPSLLLIPPLPPPRALSLVDFSLFLFFGISVHPWTRKVGYACIWLWEGKPASPFVINTATLLVLQRERKSMMELSLPCHLTCAFPTDSVFDFKRLLSVRFYALTCPSVCLLQTLKNAVCVQFFKCV